jgi:hypothetical protein
VNFWTRIRRHKQLHLVATKSGSLKLGAIRSLVWLLLLDVPASLFPSVMIGSLHCEFSSRSPCSLLTFFARRGGSRRLFESRPARLTITSHLLSAAVAATIHFLPINSFQFRRSHRQQRTQTDRQTTVSYF